MCVISCSGACGLNYCPNEERVERILATNVAISPWVSTTVSMKRGLKEKCGISTGLFEKVGRISRQSIQSTSSCFNYCPNKQKIDGLKGALLSRLQKL